MSHAHCHLESRRERESSGSELSIEDALKMREVAGLAAASSHKYYWESQSAESVAIKKKEQKWKSNQIRSRE